MTNRQFKNFLINKSEGEICFSFSKKRNESQMFFRAKVKSTDITEQIRSIDVTSQCVTFIRNEVKNYEFALDNSYCDSDDISLNYETFKLNRPVEWVTFLLNDREYAIVCFQSFIN